MKNEMTVFRSSWTRIQEVHRARTHLQSSTPSVPVLSLVYIAKCTGQSSSTGHLANIADATWRSFVPPLSVLLGLSGTTAVEELP